MVIPWFLIPGRPYTMPVYLHACGLYSSNPEMGQRGAAEVTRKKFQLEKFSHSTVSRSFRSIEESQRQDLERRFGAEIKANSPEAPGLVNRVAKRRPTKDVAAEAGRRFPSAMDTAERRREMAVFLQAYLHACEETGLEAASRQFVAIWHKKVRRFLL